MVKNKYPIFYEIFPASGQKMEEIRYEKKSSIF